MIKKHNLKKTLKQNICSVTKLLPLSMICELFVKLYTSIEGCLISTTVKVVSLLVPKQQLTSFGLVKGVVIYNSKIALSDNLYH